MCALSISEGPFPLPLTLEKAKTLKRFSVTVEPAEKSDPANSVQPIQPAKPAEDEILKHGYDSLRRLITPVQ